MSEVEDRIVGCILGTAVGDALGLPYEGLSRRRAARLFGPPDRYRLVFGRGMVSDDTEHTCMVAQSLIAAGGDVARFQRLLAGRFRWWLLGLPAGIGLATLRSILRLWVGVSPDRSGVFSAGNGPAMRSAIIGAAIEDPAAVRAYVRASTRLTHRDPKAEFAAYAVACASHYACHYACHFASRGQAIDGEAYFAEVSAWIGPEGSELLDLLRKALDAAAAGWTTEEFADSLGLHQRVTGYSYHTAPVAIHAWLTHPRDIRAAVTAVIRCGGDTDSVAAIAGGIVGSAVGPDGIPGEWLAGLIEWPRSVEWMREFGKQLARCTAQHVAERPLGLPVLGVLGRNALFLAIVLAHGFRRLAPPY